MPPEETLPEGTDTIIEDAAVDDAEQDADEIDDEPRRGATPGDAGLGASLLGHLDGLSGQANDRLQGFVGAGKDRFTGAIDDLVRMIEDVAGEIDAKVGTQYGDYARRAADSVDGIAQTIKDKDVDTLFAEARGFIARSPGVAVGVAATLGFVIARIARAGLDEPAPPPSRRGAA